MIRGAILTAALVFSFGVLAMADEPANNNQNGQQTVNALPDDAAPVITVRVSTTDPTRVEYLEGSGLMDACVADELKWKRLEDKRIIDSEILMPDEDKVIYFSKEKKDDKDTGTGGFQISMANAVVAGHGHFNHRYDTGHFRYQPYYYSNPDSYYYEPCGSYIGIGPFSYYSYCK